MKMRIIDLKLVQESMKGLCNDQEPYHQFGIRS